MRLLAPGVCVLATLVVVMPSSGITQSVSAPDLLKKARRARNLDALGSLRARPLRLEYTHEASWASGRPGTLTIELGRPGTYGLAEFEPWRTFTRRTTRLDARSFEGQFSSATETHQMTAELAGDGMRAKGLGHWLAFLHEAPDWVRPEYVSEPPNAVRARGANIDMLLEFDPATGLLTRTTQNGTRTKPGEPLRVSAWIITTYSGYTAHRGVMFPSEFTARFKGGPPQADGQSFTSRLIRVSF